MDWLRSKTAIVVIFFLALAGVQGYALLTMRNSTEERITSIEETNAQSDEKITVLSSDLDVVVKKLGVTTQELEVAQETAKQLKLDNDRMRRALAAKADSKAVLQYQTDTATRIDDATTKIDGIHGDVKVVRTDLDTTRGDLSTTRSDLDVTRNDLKATREEVANSRRDLGSLIARNSSELADLRKKGERDYFEFDLTKSNQFQRVGDVMLQLKKT